MERLYRIEVDILLDDCMRSKVIQAARDAYQNSGGYWAEDNGDRVRITPQEFVVDTRTAFLALAESGFERFFRRSNRTP